MSLLYSCGLTVLALPCWVNAPIQWEAGPACHWRSPLDCSIRSSAWEKTATQEGGSNERATCENVFIVVVDVCLVWRQSSAIQTDQMRIKWEGKGTQTSVVGRWRFLKDGVNMNWLTRLSKWESIQEKVVVFNSFYHPCIYIYIFISISLIHNKKRPVFQK